MRKLAVWVLSICLLVGLFAFNTVPASAATQSITITSPNGTESWSAGSVHAIKWSFTGLTGNVKIELCKVSSGLINTIVNNRAIGIRSYNWSIPWDLVPADDYYIRISSILSPAIFDISDANFSVVKPTITVVSPDGGEQWGAGTTHTINWTSTGTTGTVKIELYKNGVFNRIISSNRAIGTGSSALNWVVPTSQAHGNDYSVRITSNSKPDVSDNSTDEFSIGNALNLTSPVGGETWVTGTVHAITWNHTTFGGLKGNIKIELLKGGLVKKILTSNRSVTAGTYNWTIPATLPDGNDYAIRISSVTNKAINSTSGLFTLSGSLLTVVSPNTDNDTWVAGSAQNICWNATRVGGWLKIELWRHVIGPTEVSPGPDYVYDRLIAAGRDAAVRIGGGPGYWGSYRWHLPLDLQTGDYKIKIISLSNTRIYDFSDVDFHIIGSSMTVTSPAGGEIWVTGNQYDIDWDYTGILTGDVKLDLYKDGGFLNTISYAPIGPDGSGTFPWIIPANQADAGTDNYSIRVNSVLFPGAFDNSNLFSIYSANNVVTTLLSASAITYGDNVTDNVTVTPLIAGTPTGYVDFQVSSDAGANWSTYDNKTLNGSGQAVSTAYTPDNAGTYYFRALYKGNGSFAPSQSGNLAEPLTVNQRALTVTAATDTKEYDGDNTSDGVPTITSGSLVSGDTENWTQTFDNKNVGTNKTLTPAGSVNDGNGGANYSYTFVPDTTGVITQIALTVTAATDTKEYDGDNTSDGVPTLTTGSLAAGDTVTWTQTFDNKTVGSNKTLTPAGSVSDGNSGANYSYNFVPDTTGQITAKALTVTGIIANNKEFDGFDNATLDCSGNALVGIIGVDDVTLDNSTYTANFDNATVGDDKPVTVTGLALSGADAGNYTLTQPSDLVADITPI